MQSLLQNTYLKIWKTSVANNIFASSIYSPSTRVDSSNSPHTAPTKLRTSLLKCLSFSFFSAWVFSSALWFREALKDKGVNAHRGSFQTIGYRSWWIISILPSPPGVDSEMCPTQCLIKCPAKWSPGFPINTLFPGFSPFSGSLLYRLHVCFWNHLPYN